MHFIERQVTNSSLVMITIAMPIDLHHNIAARESRVRVDDVSSALTFVQY